MAETQSIFVGVIRRIDFEPKYYDFVNYRIYAHVFLEDPDAGEANQVDLYTDDPRLEAALLAAFEPLAEKAPKVEVHWEETYAGTKKIVRVALDRGPTKP
jgi:hypothetical protein